LGMLRTATTPIRGPKTATSSRNVSRVIVSSRP
jgi:hypothetical protein